MNFNFASFLTLNFVDTEASLIKKHFLETTKEGKKERQSQLKVLDHYKSQNLNLQSQFHGQLTKSSLLVKRKLTYEKISYEFFEAGGLKFKNYFERNENKPSKSQIRGKSKRKTD